MPSIPDGSIKHRRDFWKMDHMNKIAQKINYRLYRPLQFFDLERRMKVADMLPSTKPILVLTGPGRQTILLMSFD
jgi:hypothetical protein